MKNSLKRFLALALMAVLLVSMVACANTSETTSTPSESGTASGGDTSTAPDPDKEYLDENGQYVPKVGVLDEYKGEGWRMFALMKKVIDDNNFDFNKRMAELGK